jgi:biopolymer transport protein ExbB/TolQ/uncharacterized protein YoxC
VALALSAVMQQLINTAVPPTAYVYRLFRPAGGWIMGIVPGLIAFVLIWTLTDLVMKLRVTRADERDMRRPEISQLPSLVRQENTRYTVQRLRGWDIGLRSRHVGRRMQWLLHHLDSTDAPRAHELLRHQSDLDAESASSSYSTVKLFIWAMPILGFIGTVLGISLAVGGFSDFLTSSVSIDEIDRVTAELGEVASGLSFAFDTTLLGLLAGLVASVVSSGVQHRQERLLTTLDELGLRILAGVTPAAAAAVEYRGGDVPSQQFDEMMSSRLEELSVQMEAFTKSVQRGLDGFLGQWAKLPMEVDKVAEDLSGVREHLTTAAQGTGQLIMETNALLENVGQASATMGRGVEESIGSVSRAVEALGRHMQTVSKSLVQGLNGLGEHVESSQGQLSSGLATLQEAIETNHKDETASEQAMQLLSAAIVELGQSLDQFRDTQAQLAPVLDRLTGPMELRLMPTLTTPSAPPEAQQNSD